MNDKIKILKKRYKFGKAQTLSKCCREIRIGRIKEVGDIESGYNTITNQHEKWVCIKIGKPGSNFMSSTIMQFLIEKE
jgi:hypothetical protein